MIVYLKDKPHLKMNTNELEVGIQMAMGDLDNLVIDGVDYKTFINQFNKENNKQIENDVEVDKEVKKEVKATSIKNKDK